MRLTAITAAIIGGFLALPSGCTVVHRPAPEVVVVESDRHGPPPWAPAHGWRRKHEVYYYYPAIQVYYYPNVQKYYWLEGGHWKVGARLPRHHVLEEHERVILELDYDPHTQHAKIKELYPPDYYEKKKGKER